MTARHCSAPMARLRWGSRMPRDPQAVSGVFMESSAIDRLRHPQPVAVLASTFPVTSPAAAPVRRRWRLLPVLATVGVVSLGATTVGVTMARESAVQVSAADSFAAGNVAVGLGGGTSVACNAQDLAPGDASTGYPSGTGVANQTRTQCRYFVTYTGSAPAYLAVDVSTTNGTTSLYDATATGLQLLVKDSLGTTYVGSAANQGGTKFTTQGGSSFGSTLASPGSASDLLVSTSSKTNTFTDEFTIDYWMAVPSSNANIGGSSTVTLTFHAVQASSNPLPVACNASGIACTGLTWS